MKKIFCILATLLIVSQSQAQVSKNYWTQRGDTLYPVNPNVWLNFLSATVTGGVINGLHLRTMVNVDSNAYTGSTTINQVGTLPLMGIGDTVASRAFARATVQSSLDTTLGKPTASVTQYQKQQDSLALVKADYIPQRFVYTIAGVYQLITQSGVSRVYVTAIGGGASGTAVYGRGAPGGGSGATLMNYGLIVRATGDTIYIRVGAGGVGVRTLQGGARVLGNNGGDDTVKSSDGANIIIIPGGGASVDSITGGNGATFKQETGGVGGTSTTNGGNVNYITFGNMTVASGTGGGFPSASFSSGAGAFAPGLVGTSLSGAGGSPSDPLLTGTGGAAATDQTQFAAKPGTHGGGGAGVDDNGFTWFSGAGGDGVVIIEY